MDKRARLAASTEPNGRSVKTNRPAPRWCAGRARRLSRATLRNFLGLGCAGGGDFRRRAAALFARGDDDLLARLQVGQLGFLAVEGDLGLVVGLDLPVLLVPGLLVGDRDDDGFPVNARDGALDDVLFRLDLLGMGLPRGVSGLEERGGREGDAKRENCSQRTHGNSPVAPQCGAGDGRGACPVGPPPPGTLVPSQRDTPAHQFC
jgi:hypothetical protein